MKILLPFLLIAASAFGQNTTPISQYPATTNALPWHLMVLAAPASGFASGHGTNYSIRVDKLLSALEFASGTGAWSFNGRYGNILLSTSDITNSLGFMPLNGIPLNLIANTISSPPISNPSGFAQANDLTIAPGFSVGFESTSSRGGDLVLSGGESAGQGGSLVLQPGLDDTGISDGTVDVVFPNNGLGHLFAVRVTQPGAPVFSVDDGGNVSFAGAISGNGSGLTGVIAAVTNVPFVSSSNITWIVVNGSNSFYVPPSAFNNSSNGAVTAALKIGTNAFAPLNTGGVSVAPGTNILTSTNASVVTVSGIVSPAMVSGQVGAFSNYAAATYAIVGSGGGSSNAFNFGSSSNVSTYIFNGTNYFFVPLSIFDPFGTAAADLAQILSSNYTSQTQVNSSSNGSFSAAAHFSQPIANLTNAIQSGLITAGINIALSTNANGGLIITASGNGGSTTAQGTNIITTTNGSVITVNAVVSPVGVSNTASSMVNSYSNSAALLFVVKSFASVVSALGFTPSTNGTVVLNSSGIASNLTVTSSTGSDTWSFTASGMGYTNVSGFAQTQDQGIQTLSQGGTNNVTLNGQSGLVTAIAFTATGSGSNTFGPSIFTNWLAVTPASTGPTWAQTGVSNTILLWSSNSIPPVMFKRVFNVNSNATDTPTGF